MKDPLLDFIQENKDNFDTQEPKPKNWDKIESRIQKPKRNKSIIYYISALAAVLVLSLYVVNFTNIEKNSFKILCSVFDLTVFKLKI